MTAPLDYQSPTKHQRPSRFPTVVVVLVLLVGLGMLLFRPLLGLLMAFALRGTSNIVTSRDTISQSRLT